MGFCDPMVPSIVAYACFLGAIMTTSYRSMLVFLGHEHKTVQGAITWGQQSRLDNDRQLGGKAPISCPVMRRAVRSSSHPS